MEKYEELKIEIIAFDNEDIITESLGNDSNGGDGIGDE